MQRKHLKQRVRILVKAFPQPSTKRPPAVPASLRMAASCSGSIRSATQLLFAGIIKRVYNATLNWVAKPSAASSQVC